MMQTGVNSSIPDRCTPLPRPINSAVMCSLCVASGETRGCDSASLTLILKRRTRKRHGQTLALRSQWSDESRDPTATRSASTSSPVLNSSELVQIHMISNMANAC